MLPCDDCGFCKKTKRVKPWKIGDVTLDELDLGLSEIWVNGWGVNWGTGFKAYMCARKPLPLGENDLENYELCYDERKHGYIMCRLLNKCGVERRFYQ